MKEIYDAIDKAIDVIEMSKPYVPSHIFSQEAVPLLRKLRGISFQRHANDFKLKRKRLNTDDIDTVPQDLLD